MPDYYWYVNTIGDPVVSKKPPKVAYRMISSISLYEAYRHVRELIFCERIVRAMKKAKN